MTAISSGTAQLWGPLWGARARVWATIEEQQLPTYETAIRRLPIGAGTRVLDVGCGSGVFLRAAADRGAHPSGVDASEELLAIARERVPEADVRRGDMQQLPFEDGRFDVVAGFNSFFYAADMVGALREAGRVAKPGAAVLVQVWGDPERCALDAMKTALMAMLPAGGAPPPLWHPGVLEELVSEAGLVPQEPFRTRWAYEFADEAALLEGMLASGGGVAALAHAGREVVEKTILDSVAPYRAADGSYRLENEWHFLIARSGTR